jgi:hypothetical protein
MSQDTRGGLLWDDEPGLEDKDSTWEHDRDFDLTEEDFQVMNSMGWEPNDLPSDRAQDRYRQYLTKKQ